MSRLRFTVGPGGTNPRFRSPCAWGGPCVRVPRPEHPDILTTRHEHARWTGEAGDAAEARDQFAALLPIRERILGAEHPETMASRRSLANWTRQAAEGPAETGRHDG
jgi:hypothetical protein